MRWVGNERAYAVASGHCPQWFITISATGLIQLARCCLSSVLVKVILESYPPSTATSRAPSGRSPDDIIRYYFHLSLLHGARESHAESTLSSTLMKSLNFPTTFLTLVSAAQLFSR